MDFIFRAAKKYLKKHERLQRFRKVFAVLAAVVVFATTYELILPAITMDSRRAADTPGVEVGVAAEEQTEETVNEPVESDGSIEEAAQEESVGEVPEEAPAEEAAIDETQNGGGGEASKEAHAASGENTSNTEAGRTDPGDTQSESSESLERDITSEKKSAAEQTASDSATVTGQEGNIVDTDPAAANADPANISTTADQTLEYPVTLTFEGEDYTITATFDENAGLPAGVSLDALEILPDMIYKDADGNVLYDDYDTYFEKAADAIEKDQHIENTGLTSARFFDIRFIDPEGYEAAPAGPVNIAVKYEDALSAEDTACTAAVHFDEVNDKAEVVETRENVIKDTIDEISFEGEKFSVYAIVGIWDDSGNEINVAESDSVTFAATVTESNSTDYSWSVTQNPDVVEITAQNDQEVALKAGATGTAKVTLSYKYKQKKKSYSASKVYTVTVEERENELVEVPDAEYELENTENHGLTVQIKETGQVKKALSAYKLVVRPVTDTDDAYAALESAVEEDTGDSAFDFLKMYHIYFAGKEDTTDTEIPYDQVLNALGIGNMNLQVTMTYDTPPEGWPSDGKNVKVCHYKTTGSSSAENLAVTNEGISVEENGTNANVQSIRVSGNSVTFHLKSFSTITLSSARNTESAVNVNTDPGNAEFTQADDYKTWQIVNQGGMNAYNYVRVHKTVTKNEEENSFSVKLWIDLKQQSLVQQVLSNGDYAMTHSSIDGPIGIREVSNASNLTTAVNTYKSQNGEYFTEEAASEGIVLNGKMVDKDHLAKYTIVITNTDTNEKYSVTRYAVNGQFKNGGLYVRVSDGGTFNTSNDDVWITVGNASKSKGNAAQIGNIEMTQSEIETMIGYSLYSDIGSVTDTMGSNIALDKSSVVADGTVNVSDDSITWNPVKLTRLTEGTGENAGWYTNVAQMTYNVTLTPSVSTGLTMDEELPEKSLENTASEEVNINASYSYTVIENNEEVDATAIFPKPYIRGMLYEIKIKKVDVSDGTTGLPGAVFTLYNDPNCTKTVATSEETGSDGCTSFKDLLCGTYYLKETKAPDGYEISEASARAITVGYFDNTQGDTASDENAKAPAATTLEGQGEHEDLLNDLTGTPFSDVSKGVPVIIKKRGVDTDGAVVETALGGAKFTIYESNGTTVAVDKSGRNLSNLESNSATGVVFDGKLLPGTYIVRETSAPAGYTKAVDYTIVISGGTPAAVMASHIDSDGSRKEETLTENEGGIFELVISNVQNQLSVKIIKIGNNDVNKTLSNVGFTVTKEGDSSYSQNWTSNDEGVIYEGNLPAGTYSLTEVSPPEGYNALTGAVSIVVDPSAEDPVTSMQSDFHGGEIQAAQLVEGVYLVYVNNNPGAELPHTGGTGFISPQTLCGIMAMAFVLATAVMYSFSERRGERRYK